MGNELHLGDPVEIITDRFADQGVPRGSIGTVVDDWADGSNDVEVVDSTSRELVARFRAAEDEVRLYEGPLIPKEERKHGFVFGRGDDLGAPPGDPPSRFPSQFAGMPMGGILAPVGDVPPEGTERPEDIPWELREPPQTGPIFY